MKRIARSRVPAMTIPVLLSTFLPRLAAVALLLTSCTPNSSITATSDVERTVGGKLQDLTANPARYDGRRVTVVTCLFATDHGMHLVDCDDLDGPLVAFVAGEDPRGYRKVREAGTESFWARKSAIVSVTGTFVVSKTRPRFTMIIDSAEVQSWPQTSSNQDE